MTEKEKQLYLKTKERLRRLGKENPADVILVLAEEVEYYRDKVLRLEEALEMVEKERDELKKQRDNCFTLSVPRVPALTIDEKERLKKAVQFLADLPVNSTERVFKLEGRDLSAFAALENLDEIHEFPAGDTEVPEQ